jgi:hypothetical protein
MDSQNGSSSSVVQCIPVDGTSNVITFTRDYDFQFRVFENVIDVLEIALMDESENYIDLNNQHWNLVLCFSSYIDLKRFEHNRSFHNVLANAYI